MTSPFEVISQKSCIKLAVSIKFACLPARPSGGTCVTQNTKLYTDTLTEALDAPSRSTPMERVSILEAVKDTDIVFTGNMNMGIDCATRKWICICDTGYDRR